MRINEFESILRSASVVDELANQLYNKHYKHWKREAEENPTQIAVKTNLNELKQILPTVDKMLFVDFRELKITQAQLKVRDVEVKTGVKHRVIDDLRSEVKPSFLVKKEHAGILYRLMRQKAEETQNIEFTSRPTAGFDVNHSLEHEGEFNVDKLREYENIPLGTRCMRSLLSQKHT